MIERAGIGAALALVIALFAWRAHWLTRGGAVLAVVVGTATTAAGWSFGAALIAFFISSSALSHFRRAEKEHRAAGVVAKGGARDAWQVAANGAVAALAAVAWQTTGEGWLIAAAGGAIAAATADTWATELGMLSSAPPRSVTSGRQVPVGTSGGVNVAGLLAALGGAAFISTIGSMLGWPRPIALAVLAGGVLGMLADSLLGALAQSRRQCERCGAETERRIHDCGGSTRHVAGLSWLDNDGVNLLATVAGAAAAAIIARAAG